MFVFVVVVVDRCWPYLGAGLPLSWPEVVVVVVVVVLVFFVVVFVVVVAVVVAVVFGRRFAPVLALGCGGCGCCCWPMLALFERSFAPVLALGWPI